MNVMSLYFLNHYVHNLAPVYSLLFNKEVDLDPKTTWNIQRLDKSHDNYSLKHLFLVVPVGKVHIFNNWTNEIVLSDFI